MNIKKCTCKSVYQDKIYGKGKRAHNATKKLGQFRCTCCGTIN